MLLQGKLYASSASAGTGPHTINTATYLCKLACIQVNESLRQPGINGEGQHGCAQI